MYTKARFDSHFMFFNVQLEDLQIMNIRFKIFGRSKFFMSNMIVEGFLSLKDCKFQTSLSDTLMYVKIPLISPFVMSEQT
ncbi:hypothetical protein MXB_4256 [Myxobolus squamalis]|nr:hypothetical protein MXB_4256 [Myxobolus squamalis]